MKLVSDDFQWEFTPPSTLLFLELYEEEITNSEGQLDFSAYVKVKYNNQLVNLKERCNNVTECELTNFVCQLRDQGIIMNQQKVQVCDQTILPNQKYEFESPNEFLNYIYSY